MSAITYAVWAFTAGALIPLMAADSHEKREVQFRRRFSYLLSGCLRHWWRLRQRGPISPPSRHWRAFRFLNMRVG